MRRYPINRPKRTFFIILLLIPFILAAHAQELCKSIVFSKSHLRFEKRDGFDVVTYGDLDLTLRPGAPQLPRQIVPILLPDGKAIVSLTIKNIHSEILPGEYYLYPLQRPHILANEKVDFTTPDEAIYQAAEPYPKEIVTLATEGYFCGQNIGAVCVHPLQYLPSLRKLCFISSLEIELTLREKSASAIPCKETPYTLAIKTQALNVLKGDLEHPSLHKDQVPFGERYGLSHSYVIITADHLVTSFQPLSQWKTQKGLAAKIVTTSYIYTNFPGRDQQEKIRNFIIHAHKNWGTIWVLLAGDTNIIPARYAFAFDCETDRKSDNDIPCDLYFADLDGNWDADGDGIFGEVADNIDMYPDVFLGRAAVENAEEADAFVNKVLTYEKKAPHGHELNMLFLAEVLWQNPYTNSGEGKDHIDQRFVPERFDPITKLYTHLGNENAAAAREALNRGYNIINHDGHAWYTLLSVGDGSLKKADMDNLRNGPKYSILFSIGCWPAAFDYDCIAEHFLTNPLGGGVAFVGNSRYGWGSPGNPLYGYSDRFDQQFFKQLFVEYNNHIGVALSAAKAVYVPFARQENVYRWCEYELNLLGDPEMAVWTDQPRMLSVSYPPQLPLGSSSCAIHVADGAQPLANALVCLMQDTVVYVTGLTGKDGHGRLSITTQNAAAPLQLTVTSPNYLPYSTTIALMSEKPYLSVESFGVEGLDNQLLKPDAEIYLNLEVKNHGMASAQAVWGTLSSDELTIVVKDSSEYFGDIPAGAKKSFAHAFKLQTPKTLTNGTPVRLRLRMFDGSGNSWDETLVLTAATPVLALNGYATSDPLPADGDGFIEAGETIVLSLNIKNNGLDVSATGSLEVSSSDGFITLPSQPLPLPAIAAGQNITTKVSATIASNCPMPKFIPIRIMMTFGAAYSFCDSLLLAVGVVGFRDNMERGAGLWTHYGKINLWHLSTARTHSGKYAWYCGDAQKRTYQNFMDNSLISQPFVIEGHSQLSFWCWYQFPNYGVNGIYPEVNGGSGWQTLDFIGSGGALPILPTGNDWLEYTYDLSHFPAGTTLQVRFRFVSDNENVTEGIYIDDVVVCSKTRSTGIDGDKPLKTYELLSNYPNPFNAITTIIFYLPELQPTTLTVYDVHGRLVATLIEEKPLVGRQQCVWDAWPLPSGIYFYRLKSGRIDLRHKCVLLR